MINRFGSRSLELERLDRGDYTRQEYARLRREMPWIHGFFGEVRALRNSLVAEIVKLDLACVSILDVGAGPGDLLKDLRGRLGGRNPKVVAADLVRDGLRDMDRHELLPVQCSGARLPFAGESFDYAISTLTFHHLDDATAVAVLREMARVASRRVFIVDLNRAPVAYHLYRLVGPLFLQRFTVEDGALSILRSRTPNELRDLAIRAGLSNVAVTASRVNRLVLSGTKS